MQKIHHIILYIINYFQRNFSNSDLGIVKLNKILWFADRAYMYKHYKSISGCQYIKNPQGPVLKKMNTILQYLEKQGYIKEIEVNKALYLQKSYIALQEANLSKITASQISIIDEMCFKFAKKTAKELSKLSHDESWEKAKNGDIMPIESVFLDDIQTASEKDIVKGLS